MRAIVLVLMLGGCVSHPGEPAPLSCYAVESDGWSDLTICADDDGIPRELRNDGHTGSSARATTDRGEAYTMVGAGESAEIDWPAGRPESLAFGGYTIWTAPAEVAVRPSKARGRRA